MMIGADSPTIIGDMTSEGMMIADAMRDAIHVMNAGKYYGGSIAWSATLERANGCCTNIDTPKGLYDWLWHCKVLELYFSPFMSHA